MNDEKAGLSVLAQIGRIQDDIACGDVSLENLVEGMEEATTAIEMLVAKLELDEKIIDALCSGSGITREDAERLVDLDEPAPAKDD